MSLTRLAIATAPVLFVLLWSTGFIGARYGLPYIEPLTFLAVADSFRRDYYGRDSDHRWRRGPRRT
jgi:drug/metabolite transporter (DMT)-like permease